MNRINRIISAAGRGVGEEQSVRGRVVRAMQLVILLAIALVHVVALSRALTMPGSGFRDFQCYYTAASLYARGQNPYDRTQNILTFLYLPTTLVFFKPFTWLSLHDAMRLWLLLKVAALMVLVWIWRQFFALPLGFKQGVLITIGLTFAIVQDLVTGNVSLIEQVLLWGALAALTKGRYWYFAVGIVLVSQFKLLFLLFLPCVFLMDGGAPARRQQWIALGGAVGLFLGTLAVSFAIWPAWPRAMAANVLHIDYNGATYDPCSRAFFQDLLQLLHPSFSSGTVRAASLGLHLVFALVVLLRSARALTNYYRQRDTHEPTVLLLFACLVFALILPRFKLYSYILILPPAMYMAACWRSWPTAIVFLLCLLPTRNFIYPLEPVVRAVAYTYDTVHVPGLLSNYTTLFALIGLWLWFVAKLSAANKDAPVLAPDARTVATHFAHKRV